MAFGGDEGGTLGETLGPYGRWTMDSRVSGSRRLFTAPSSCSSATHLLFKSTGAASLLGGVGKVKGFRDG